MVVYIDIDNFWYFMNTFHVVTVTDWRGAVLQSSPKSILPFKTLKQIIKLLML